MVALEIAERSAPDRPLFGVVAGFFPEPDQKGVRGGTLEIVAGSVMRLGAWLRSGPR